MYLSYIPSDTVLHRLHIGAKLVVLAVYVYLVFVSYGPVNVLALGLIFVAATLALGLWIRGRFLVLLTGLLLLLAMWPSFHSPLASNLIMGLGKLVSLSLAVGLFTMTTRLSQVLQVLYNRGRDASLPQQTAYMINAMVSALPSIQYDLRRAIDAETIRRGRRIGPVSFGSWVTVLIIVLVRALNRSERLADGVIDRGFDLARGISSADALPLTWRDVVIAGLCVVPGLSVLAVL